MENSYQTLSRSLSPDQTAEAGEPSASKRSLDPKRRGSKETGKNNYGQTLKLPRLYSSKRFILKHPTTSKANSKQIAIGQSKVLDTTYFPVTTRPGVRDAVVKSNSLQKQDSQHILSQDLVAMNLGENYGRMDKNISLLLQKFEMGQERNIKSTLEKTAPPAVENSPPPFKTYGYSPQPVLNQKMIPEEPIPASMLMNSDSILKIDGPEDGFKFEKENTIDSKGTKSKKKIRNNSSQNKLKLKQKTL